MRSKRSIHVVGAHAEGEVGRVIVGGVLPPPGDTLLEQRAWLAADDWLRRFLIREPRGGVFTHYNLVVPAKNPQAQAGFIIMEPTDYPPMSGSNSICVATVLLETGMLEMREPETHLTLETPGGLVEILAQCSEGRCERVTTTNVPCYAHALDLKVDVEGIGTVTFDIAYGGAFFALVDAASHGLEIKPERARDLVVVGERIKDAIRSEHEVVHPAHDEIRDVTFVTWLGPVETAGGIKTGRNATVISPGKIDRSPCGTGSSAWISAMAARGELGVGDTFLSRSIIGTEFRMRIERAAEIGDRSGIVPSISGRAWITGEHIYHLDPSDPFPEGYSLADTWHRVV